MQKTHHRLLLQLLLLLALALTHTYNISTDTKRIGIAKGEQRAERNREDGKRTRPLKHKIGKEHKPAHLIGNNTVIL